MRTLSGPDLAVLEALNAPDHRWYTAMMLVEQTGLPLFAVQASLGALRRFRLVNMALRNALGIGEHAITTLGVAELHDRGLPLSTQMELRG